METKTKSLKEQMYLHRASALDVDWDHPEIPVSLPVGLSEGASIVKMKDGSIGVIQRDRNGNHMGVQVMTEDLRKALLKALRP